MSRVEITLKQLECLLAIDRTLHFRKAASLLGVQQPTVSAQIQNLEDILGFRLIERSRSGVAMTPAGRDIVSRSREVMDKVQEIVDFASLTQHDLTGTIRLGTTPTLGPYFLPFVVRKLHKAHPHLNLYVRESGANDLEYELDQGVHDLILTQTSTPHPDHDQEVLFHEPLYLAFAIDHPLASRDQVKLNDLKGLSVLCLTKKYHFHNQVVQLAEEFGAIPSRDYEGTSLDALRQMVGMDMGFTFLPALYVHSEIRARSEISVKRITGRNITRSIALVWRRKSGQSRVYRQIAEVMRTTAKKRFSELVTG